LTYGVSLLIRRYRGCAMTDKLAATKPPTASEVWFDTYLRAHGYTWELEPDLRIPKRPDRLIYRDGLSAVCEVKQFDKDPIGWMHETGQGGDSRPERDPRCLTGQGGGGLHPQNLSPGLVACAGFACKPLDDATFGVGSRPRRPPTPSLLGRWSTVSITATRKPRFAAAS
jgi:hypothetical protein